MLTVLDGDGLLVRHEFELLPLPASQIIFEWYTGRSLDLLPGDAVGVERQLLFLVAIDLDKDVDNCGRGFHRCLSSKLLSSAGYRHAVRIIIRIIAARVKRCLLTASGSAIIRF